MPTLFGKLNAARGNKAVHSKYGQGISSTDLANYPPSPSSQDARELVYDPKEIGNLGIGEYGGEEEGGSNGVGNGHRRGNSLDNQVLSERSNNKPSLSSPTQQSPVPLPQRSATNIPAQKSNRFAEFGAPGLSANLSKSTITHQPAKLTHQPSSRMHKTLPARPVVQKPSNITTTTRGGGKTPTINEDQSKSVPHPIPYGYTTIGWDKQMDTPQVAELVLMCGEQIRMRGLTSPLIFSSMALDLSQHNVTSLIRTFLTSPKEFYTSETKFANPHDLAAVIKWALSRLGRVFPVPIPAVELMSSSRRNAGSEAQEENVFIHQRGFLEWDSYIAWSTYERNHDYPIASFSAFLDGLPSSTAALLVALFSLLSSTTSYSLRNGMTPSRLARMFGALMFGLPEDETFEKTYDAYVRVSNATEHLLLAYIRDMSTMEPLPTRLADHVRGYPSMLSSDLNRPGRGVRGIPFTLISRAVRLYSVDLVQQGRELDLAHKSPEWAACVGKGGEGEEREPQLSDRYRKLANIRSAGRQAEQGSSGHSPQPTPDVEAYSSLADKAWEEFLHEGFTVSDPNKLAFNLNESERKARMTKPKNVQWSQFEESGFSLADDGLNSVLAFDDLLEQDVKKWPEERAELLDKIRKTNKVMPPFNYDTTPVIVSSPSSSGDPLGQWQEKPISRMDDIFPEVFADILLGNGWSNRDELTHRNANFVVVQYKSRPNASTVGLQIMQNSKSKSTMTGLEAADDRTDAAWFVIEEVVPAHYRSELEAAGRKKNRSRASLRNLSIFKRLKANSTLYNTGGDSFFDDVFKPGLGTQTKKLTLSSQQAIDIESRRDSQSSTVRNASSPLHASHPAFGGGDDGQQHVSSSVRLLTSLKSRASKRLRKANRDDDEEGGAGGANAPPPPPKGIPAGFVQQSTSWNSDDFETRSLRDPDLDAFAHADARRGKMLKTGARGERRRSKDDSWLDIMVHKDKRHLESGGGNAASGASGSRTLHTKAVTEGTTLTNTNGGSKSLSSPIDKNQKLSIDVAGWSREEMPAPLTPTRESSLQNLESSVDDHPSRTSITPTKSSTLNLSPQTLPRKSSTGVGDQSTASVLTTSSGWTATTNTATKKAAASPISPNVSRNVGDISNASTMVSNNGKDLNGGGSKATKKIEDDEDDDYDNDKSPTLPYLRSLPNRGEGTEEEREKARNARIEAAKERARELRANLNPVAVDDLERRKEERLKAARDSSSSPTNSTIQAATTSPAANLRANLSPVKTTTSSPSPTPTTQPKEATLSPFKSSIDPFAKDRVSGRVASLTSKFGGQSAKPLTPQSTGNAEKSGAGDISAGSIEARLRQGSFSPPTTPAKTAQLTTPTNSVFANSVSKSPTSTSSPPVPSKNVEAGVTSPLISGLPSSPNAISSSPSQWRQRQQAMSNSIDISKNSPSTSSSSPKVPTPSQAQTQSAVRQPNSSASTYTWTSQNPPSSPLLAPSEIGSRNSIDSNAIAADNDSIYPEDAASNFSPDPEDDGMMMNSGGSFTGKKSVPTTNPLSGPSLFSNLGQTPAMAGAAAAAAIAAASSSSSPSQQNSTTILTKEALQAEAQDRPTAMPPGFGQRYQPGMPLSNVEEERESVLSGSNL